jgi:catechol 2,3-dioxygenase-like lactoylglutathione lyase family enzyme
MPRPPAAEDPWPRHLPVRQVRVARPTDQLEAVRSFYCDGLGLVEIDRFADHDGYSGIMVGLPGTTYHLEFTTHIDGSPGPSDRSRWEEDPDGWRIVLAPTLHYCGPLM